MERQLRLADRRGLLSGRSLSPIAEFGVEILYHLDNRAKGEREFEEVKLAIVSNDPSRIKKLYPQWFLDAQDEDDDTEIVYDGTPEAEEVYETGSYVEDYSEVKWLSPEDEEFQELMQLQQAIASAGEVTLTNSDGGEWL